MSIANLPSSDCTARRVDFPSALCRRMTLAFDLVTAQNWVTMLMFQTVMLRVVTVYNDQSSISPIHCTPVGDTCNLIHGRRILSTRVLTTFSEVQIFHKNPSLNPLTALPFSFQFLASTLDIYICSMQGGLSTH